MIVSITQGDLLKQAAGQPLQLTFEKHNYGPYSDQLRHALNRREGHFIVGLDVGNVEPEIEPVAEALAEAQDYIVQSRDEALQGRLARVQRLIDGFQSPYGMELLATVHWVQQDGAKSSEEALARISAWSERKRALMRPEHVQAAWNRLKSEA